MSSAEPTPFYLDLKMGGSVAHRFPLVRGVQRIGRDTRCDVRLIDVTVSALHAVLDVVENPRSATYFEIYLRDHNSTNGTWVDEHRLEPGQRVALHIGSTIRCGDATLLLSGDDDADNTYTALSLGPDVT